MELEAQETRITPPAAPTTVEEAPSTALAENPPSTPPAIVSDALLAQRQDSRREMAKVLTPTRVSDILDTLFNCAMGDDERGPSVVAIKLWLEYAIGSPAALDTGEAKRALPQLSEEDIQLLAGIGARFGKDLRIIKVVENHASARTVPNNGQADRSD